MLIRAGGVTLNVTGVHQTLVTSREIIKIVKNGWFGKTKEVEIVYDCKFHYKDQDGKTTQFTWSSCRNRTQAEAIEKELLSQIKEVELEHMTASLENAIRNN